MTEAQERQEGRAKLGLWIGFLGGPVAWLCNLQASYTLVPWACHHSNTIALHLSTVFFLLLALGTGLIGHSSAPRAARVVSPRNEGMQDVAPFMGQIGVATSIFFALIILAQSASTFILSPCFE